MPGVDSPANAAAPGVFIMLEGKGVAFEGGVDGATKRVLFFGVCEALAGEGLVARNMRRSAAPSSPVAGLRSAVTVKPFCFRRADRANVGGGVRGERGGGEEWMVGSRSVREVARLKE